MYNLTLTRTLIFPSSRFSNEIERHFVKFLGLLKKNPGWSVFFDDLGVGKVPLDYLIAIEEGNRSYCFIGNSSLTMGYAKVTSTIMWATKIRDWRKMEGYVSIIRKIRVRVISNYTSHTTLVSCVNSHAFSYVIRPRTTSGWTSVSTTSKNETSCVSRSRPVIYRCPMERTTSRVNSPFQHNGLTTSPVHYANERRTASPVPKTSPKEKRTPMLFKTFRHVVCTRDSIRRLDNLKSLICLDVNSFLDIMDTVCVAFLYTLYIHYITR